ncbi:hypothetical protein ACJ72_05456 [Emergomyces africanus]|uniref:Peptidase M20 dimerisation domain-containing protein n=1 Tax=Emergomyces africanus TaxID=1955775 RepID=A0A1B7NUD4_9EURO|nr:hypothetical protein ACJ72_05456 [Emergomyces africanus]
MASFTADEISQVVELHRPVLAPYEDFYKHLHAHPELSHQEYNTAKTVTNKLQQLSIPDLKIHTGVGGTGVVAVLPNKNGKGASSSTSAQTGPTILLRSELDALPVREQTNLPYASKETTKDANDDHKQKPTMHACGHDMHMTCLLAATEALASPALRARWHGTLVILFQPAEELGNGATRMIADGLFSPTSPYNIPIPDVFLGQHVLPARAGAIGMKPGAQMAASDCLKVTFHGRGGHASMPQATIDPIVMASSAVVRLQTIASREMTSGTVDGLGVVSVGSLHAGSAANIIPATAEMEVNIRTANEATRAMVLASVERIVHAESQASGAEREPEITHTLSFPVTVNDTAVTERLGTTFARMFDDDGSAPQPGGGGGRGMNGYCPGWPRSNASEDFGCLGASVGKPSCFWFFGGVDPLVWDEAEKNGTTAKDIPVNHSPFFAPTIQPTMRVGVDALVGAALTFLGKRA